MAKKRRRFREAKRFVKIFWLPLFILSLAIVVQLLWWENKLPIIFGGFLTYASLFRNILFRQWLGKRMRSKQSFRNVFPKSSFLEGEKHARFIPTKGRVDHHR